jgi:hypothetical protein
MATKVGTLVKIEIDGVELVGEVSANLASACNLIDVSSKASGNESNFEYGRVSETGSFESLASTDPAATKFGYKQAKEAQYAGTKVVAVITEYDSGGSEVVGAIKTTGTALISNVSWDIPDNDRMTFSMDVQFDGKTADTTNA